MAAYFQTFQRSLLIFHTLKLVGQGLYFTGMIIWLQYLFPLWEPQMLFSQQALQDSQKVISALNAKQIQIRKVILQSKLALDILMAAQGRICAIIHTQYCTYIPVMSTNITHFTKHMNTMIEAMDTPEVSVTSLWETLTSSSWWKTILIIIILICWERAPPMAKVMRKEAWHTQRRDRASGVPLEILEHLPPKPESA